jgi:hypothetical protein
MTERKKSQSHRKSGPPIEGEETEVCLRARYVEASKEFLKQLRRQAIRYGHVENGSAFDPQSRTASSEDAYRHRIKPRLESNLRSSMG